MIQGKRIILGISGGIAAYKSPLIIRQLIKLGAEVKVVATPNAMEFVTKTTLETLSKNKLYVSVFGDENDYTTEHIALTDWADILLVAPATANVIGKFANGIADDALTTTFLAFDKQVYLAPSMNTKMYSHYSFEKNLSYLLDKGVKIIEPSDGFLACGYEGKGRMAEPEDIVSYIQKDLSDSLIFKGKSVLITAGATVEPIDPVRYISNYSTGKMGYALAETFTSLGADVVLVSGESKLVPPKVHRLVKVKSAEEMYQSVMQNITSQDIIIMSAAVADYTPKNKANHKIKKSDTELYIELVKTKDILAEAGKRKNQNQLLIGFALETNDELKHAQQKLQKKNLDFIIMNSLQDKGAGFGYDTNKIVIIDAQGHIKNYDLKSKKEVAMDIACYAYQYIQNK